MLTEAYDADDMKMWVLLGGMKGLKKVKQAWKITKEHISNISPDRWECGRVWKLVHMRVEELSVYT